MRKLSLIVFSVFLFVSLGSVGNAFDQGACEEDVQKYCKDVKMGEGRIKACLEKNAEKLSQGCKANLFDAAMKKKANEAK